MNSKRTLVAAFSSGTVASANPSGQKDFVYAIGLVQRSRDASETMMTGARLRRIATHVFHGMQRVAIIE